MSTMKEKQSVWESIRFARALDSRKLKKRFIGAGTQPPKGNVFVYFGNDANNFARIFNAVGNTVQIFNQLRAVSEVLK